MDWYGQTFVYNGDEAHCPGYEDACLARVDLHVLVVQSRHPSLNAEIVTSQK